jgi:hypothetical protein
LILCGGHLVLQAPILDCETFDPFSLHEDFLTASEVNVGWREVAEALVTAMIVVMLDEGPDPGFEIAW